MEVEKLPFSWRGTKVTLRKSLLPIIDKIQRTLYVEPFCGAGGLFLGKEQERAEVLNDTNSALIACFKVLRDHDQAWALQTLLERTSMARATYYELAELARTYAIGGDIAALKERLNLTTYRDDFAAAYAFFYVQNTCYSGGGFTPSFGGGAKSWDSARIIGGYARARARATCYIDRLKTVCFENLDALDCIAKYDDDQTLFFVDPPYRCKSSAGGYKHDWTQDDDARLVDALADVKGSYVLTVYDTPDYQRLLEHGAHYVGVARKTTMPTIKKAMTTRVETIYIKANHERRCN